MELLTREKSAANAHRTSESARATSPAELGPVPRREQLDQFEDALVARCKKIARELRANLRKSPGAPGAVYAANAPATHAAAGAYNAEVVPALRHLQGVAAADAERVSRVNAHCGAVLGLIGTGWELSGEIETAESTLAMALKLVRGSSAEARVRLDHDRCAALVKADRERDRLAAALAGDAGPRPAYTRPRKATSDSAWGVVLVTVGLFVGRCCLRAGCSSSSHRVPTYTPPWRYEPPPQQYDLPRWHGGESGAVDVDDDLKRRFTPSPAGEEPNS